MSEKLVAAAVMCRNNKYLVARRAPGQPLAGKWEFPGGKVEAGETPEQCLQRELKEEFGINATVGDFLVESLHTYEFGSIRLLAYHVKVGKEELQLRVHDELFWGQPDELLDLELLPADVIIVKKLKEELSSV